MAARVPADVANVPGPLGALGPLKRSSVEPAKTLEPPKRAGLPITAQDKFSQLTRATQNLEFRL